MGGGDLNLKKSWHPSTFSNLERVWQAEQKDESERKKIEQLQQELKEERAREELQRTAEEAGAVKKKDARVEWLYSGPTAATVNREEYLLGKKIDKAIDPTLQEAEREKEAVVAGGGALFIDSGSSGANSSADIAMKIREDPLFLIKQKELEAKKKLASNPVKLKRLQQLLETKERAKTSHGHRKKHKRERDRDSESPPTSNRVHRRSRSPVSRKEWTKDSQRSSPYSRRDSHRDQSSTSYRRTQDPCDSRRPQLAYKSSSKSSSTTRQRYQPYSKPQSRTRNLNPEELERRRQEMMADAKEHDKHRGKRLRLHEELEKKEVEVKDSGDFLQPLRVQSLSTSSSLKDRIHRKINSVQRTSSKLDSHFMSK